MGVIKRLMKSIVDQRMGLGEIFRLEPIRRLGTLTMDDRVVDGEMDMEMGIGRKAVGAALVEEEQWFLPFILGETE